MRKTVAFFLGMFLVFTLGYATLHRSLFLITDWLGPLLGKTLLTALTLIYLLLGDPIEFLALGTLWAGVALLGGVIIRRRMGAVLTMLLVFTLLLPALGLSAFGLYQIVSGLRIGAKGGNPLDLLPPLPQGLSIASLFEAPIIGKVIQTVIDMFGGDSPQGAGLDVAMQVLGPLLVDLAMKPIIVVVAALIGVDVGKMLEPSLKPWSESLRVRLGGRPGAAPDVFSIFQNRIVLVATICLLLISASFSCPHVAGAAEESFYSENLFGFVDDQGRGVMGDVFVESGMSVGGVDMGDPATQGLVASVLISHEGITKVLPDLGNATGGFDPSSIVTMLPPTFMVAVYLDVPKEVAEQRADTISSAFSSSFGVGLQKLVAFESPASEGGTEQMPSLSFVVYYSSADLEDVAGRYLKQFAHHGGLAEIVDEASTSGRLIPGEMPDSADGSVFMTGFVNLESLLDYMPENRSLPLPVGGLNATGFVEELMSLFEGPLGFSGGVSFWEHGVEPQEDGYGFNLMELLGIEEGASLSYDSDLSLVLVAMPEEAETVGNDTLPNAKVVSSLPLEAFGMGEAVEALSEAGLFTQVPPGGTIPSSSLQLSISGEIAMPLIVSVTKEVSPNEVGPDGTVQVTVTVSNEDTKSMRDVQLNDDYTAKGYPISSMLVSGSTSESWGEIGPGASRSMTYTLRLREAGIYSLTPATVDYTHLDVKYAESSGRVEVRIFRPDPVSFTLSSMMTFWATAVDLLDIPTGGNGSTLLSASVLLFFAVLAVLEYRKFRKWLQG